MKQLLHTPEGVRDIYNGECEYRLKLESSIRRKMNLYGFRDIKTPMFEYFDVFSSERGTVESRDMYKFFDRDGNTLVLRPDMTPAIARCVAKYYKEETMPVRLSYCGSTFINENDYQGKLKEITQIGAELINDDSVEADAEMIALTVECLLEAGLSEFQVEVGQADFFRALVEEARLSNDEIEHLRYSVIEKNTFGMEDILEGKEIRKSTKEALLRLPELFGTMQTLSVVREITENPRALKTVERLETLYDRMKAYGFEKYITFDLGALSKYNYYTGITFRAYTYGTGNPLVTGGRYDSLVGQFGKQAAAIGFALSLDEMMAAMSRQKLAVSASEERILIRYKKENYAEAVKHAAELRGNGTECVLLQYEENADADTFVQYCKRHSVSREIVLG